MNYGFSDGQNSQTYFAADTAENLANNCLRKAGSFYNTLQSNMYLDTLVKMWRYYHGIFNDQLNNGYHEITFGGQEGELAQLPVNHFRNIAEHIKNMILSDRPTMETRSINTDAKSLSQTYLAEGILDYYMREKKLEDYIQRCTEMAIVLGSSYLRMEWNATAGETYDVDPETGESAQMGEMEFTTLSPFDVVFDGTKEYWSNEWLIVRSYQNRFSLAAKYPELKEKILGLATKSDANIYRLSVFSNDQTDDIPVYEFFHKRTPALPEGRYTMFLSDDIIPLDLPLPYREIPIYRIAAGEYMGTPYGYSPMFDLYPLQEAINATNSTILTNQSAFGVQNLFVERGSDIDINSLEGALNIIIGNKPPIPLQMTATPKEVFDYLEKLERDMETISGISSVTRGNPESSLKSGTALALVQSMSIQFISGLQKNYVKFVEAVGTSLISILKDFAKTPQTIAVVGKDNQYMLKDFTGDDISSINRVIVSMGNPLSKCLKKDTPVLMFDGSIKMVQDIKNGELVMGPDSKKRTVKYVTVGIEQMYDIHSSSEKNEFLYGCNESHILSLSYCSSDERYGLKQYEIIDVSVKEFLEWPESKRRKFMGYRTGVEFGYKETLVDPYFLGLWLGDGDKNEPRVTNNDIEIQNYIIAYGEKLGLGYNKHIDNRTNAVTIRLSNGNIGGSKNPLTNLLELEGVLKNKHIPNNFKINNSETRLKVLAGLIDSDGTMIDETFVISQKCNKLTDDIIYLARSLGFKVTHRKRENSCQTGAVGIYNSITIGGDTHRIPTLLKRKQATKKEKSRNWLNYGIDIKSIGEGNYYGFTLLEEPHFLLGDFTVTHNTAAGRTQMAEQMLQMGLIKTPEHYFEVITTGEIKTLYQGEMHELILIRAENEKMLEGEQVLAEPWDEHKKHLLEHRSVMANPDVRFNVDLRNIVQAHMQEHINYLRTVDPDTLMLFGEQPLQNPNAPQMPPPNPNGPPPQGGGQSGAPQDPNLAANPDQLINGQGTKGGNTMVPQPASPPAPFQQLPTNPQQVQ